MPRSTMAGLITRLRLFINDPVGPKQLFTDDQLQDYLDSNRYRIDGFRCETDGARLEFQSRHYNLETNVAFYNDPFGVNQVTPLAINYTTGTATFSSYQFSSIFVFGYSYDLHGAAAEGWLARASRAETSQMEKLQPFCLEQYEMHLEQSWPSQSDVTRHPNNAYRSNARSGNW